MPFYNTSTSIRQNSRKVCLVAIGFACCHTNAAASVQLPPNLLTAMRLRLCSLRTACFVVAFYTFFVALLMLGFGCHDYYVAPEYLLWLRVAGAFTVIILFLAGSCLLRAIYRNSGQLFLTWLVVYSLYVGYQITNIIWNCYYYYTDYDSVPEPIRMSVKCNFIVFSILLCFDILSIFVVYRYKNQTRIGRT
ncbi:hypothetical protein RvY_06227 [Ramazzottius varieornatus]|uniref:MARVEL domain-containing protein n=1 Tax=Ramazzottius varieornatus TaxID=947166 RepID=A0A1D1UXS9_RAMVA|nr:hypothetical protein RvY_06227 [Ramazzottius varieornatus]